MSAKGGIGVSGNVRPIKGKAALDISSILRTTGAAKRSSDAACAETESLESDLTSVEVLHDGCIANRQRPSVPPRESTRE